MADRSEAEVNSLLVYKSPAWKGGVLYPYGKNRQLRELYKIVQLITKEMRT